MITLTKLGLTPDLQKTENQLKANLHSQPSHHKKETRWERERDEHRHRKHKPKLHLNFQFNVNSAFNFHEKSPTKKSQTQVIEEADDRDRSQPSISVLPWARIGDWNQLRRTRNGRIKRKWRAPVILPTSEWEDVIHPLMKDWTGWNEQRNWGKNELGMTETKKKAIRGRGKEETRGRLFLPFLFQIGLFLSVSQTTRRSIHMLQARLGGDFSNDFGSGAVSCGCFSRHFPVNR